MVMGWQWPILLLWCFSTIGINRVHAQLPTDFISIDCGIPAGHNYTDSVTKIPYTSDSGFIDTGDNYNVTSVTPQESTLRSFANGPRRNCYTIKPIQNDLKYLVRATFMYGNYDGNNTTRTKPIVFNLHIGVNFWTTINIVNASVVYRAEVLIAPTRPFIWVCLVNIGLGTPFISSLEARPLEKTIYDVVTETNPLGLLARVDMGSAGKAVRYPDDLSDRIWDPHSDNISYPKIPDEWQVISTNSTLTDSKNDTFRVPSAVMQTAVIRQLKNDRRYGGNWLNFSWYGDRDWDGADHKYYMNIHFADIDERALKLLRKLNVYLNEKLLFHNYHPLYMLPGYQYSTSPLDHGVEYRVSIRGSSDSDLPPIMNALEVYYVINLTNPATDHNDVDAIMALKVEYELKRNWMGDPCAPEIYAWDGINCSYLSKLPRIIALNLSSSGLTGEISGSLANLQAITYLDLSNNNLTGSIPDFLVDLPSLKGLNLKNNSLSGSIPSALLQKYNSKQLALSTEGNPNLCNGGDSCVKKKKKSSMLTIVISVPSILFMIIIPFIWWIIWRRRKQGSASLTMVKPDDHAIQCVIRVFTYEELKKMTQNFYEEIGRGGFGTVYLGYLENGSQDCQVAVKRLFRSSEEGIKEVLSEAQLLTRVHHKNLVRLVGYCNDGNNLALVYEYMSQGSLLEHIRGKHSGSSNLNWGKRIRIALEAAQGFEYLHKGCTPPVIHGDVKTANILLGQRFEAKLADFGLSKSFINDEDTHVSTTDVRGTFGYLDPEYYRTKKLNEKSDVYSFGVVLLELVTGQPPRLQVDSETVHIVQWVKKLRQESEDISVVVDSKLQGNYAINSISKVVSIAMECTSEASNDRPIMTDVIIQLKESLDLETARSSEHSGPRSLDSVLSAK